jgi:hypothetical protein
MQGSNAAGPAPTVLIAEDEFLLALEFLSKKNSSRGPKGHCGLLDPQHVDLADRVAEDDCAFPGHVRA